MQDLTEPNSVQRDTLEDQPTLELSVIVPARDEEDVLALCLESLLTQSETGFELGREWELIVVDDHSSDQTRAIADRAAARQGVRVLDAPEFGEDSGFTGKNAACWTGAQAARGRLLLFTDADTIHAPGDLSRARHEMERYKVNLLSYSPRQLTSGLMQRAVMPLVFAELSVAYPMHRVNTAEDRTVAANGQFLMVQAEDYFALGGHRAVGEQVLEDVALAANFKRARRAIRFRYAPEAVSARMYRSTAAMVEGWTKNLALLYSSALGVGLLRLLDLILIVGIPAVALLYPFLTTLQKALLWVVWVRVVWRFYARVAKSNFPAVDCALSIAAIPLFSYLCLASWYRVRVQKNVAWKGRTYSVKR
jgi:GT2 family glycosyltransferase